MLLQNRRTVSTNVSEFYMSLDIFDLIRLWVAAEAVVEMKISQYTCTTLAMSVLGHYTLDWDRYEIK